MSSKEDRRERDVSPFGIGLGGADRLALVHSVWQVAIVATVYSMAALALRSRSAALRYMLGCTALGMMVAWPLATFLRMPMPVLATQREPAGAADDYVPPSLHEAESETVVQLPVSPPLVRTRELPELQDIIAAEFGDWHRRLEHALPWLSALWLAGVVVLAVRPLWGLAVVRRLTTRGLTPLSTELRQLAGRMMARLRVHWIVQFAESALVEVPTLVGYFRPMVLLPASAITGLSTDELEMVIAHELAHVRRHDYLVNLLQTVIEALLFYHPGMWWVSAQVRRERENCCDDVAVAMCGDRSTYIRALYTMETRRAAAAPALAASGGSLVRRIRRLVISSPVADGAGGASAWSAGLVTLVLLAIFLSFGRSFAEDATTNPPEAMAQVDTPTKSPAPSTSSIVSVPAMSDVVETTDNADAEASPGRWLAIGRVTDETGHPLPGVELSAHSGIGSLRKTGSATTGLDGRYRLEFGPGMTFERGSKAVQAATIIASKPGYFERNLNRQGDCVAGFVQPDAPDELGSRAAERLFLPGRPMTLDFVMQPAAVLEGKFVETSHGWSVREQSFYLTGPDLPPSSSVLASVATDRHGNFHIDAIPTDRSWRIGMRVSNTGIDIETQPLKFDEPGVYRCRLLLETTNDDGGAKLALRLEDLEQVATSAAAHAIDELDGEGFSQLHRAASGGHEARVRELLKQGANVDVEQRTYHGTPLQYAAAGGHGETVQALLENHATVDARDTAGRTPLMWAATNGHADVVGRLLDADANVNAAAKGGWTALHYAVDRGHVQTAQLLIDRGAKLHAKNSQGKTPFDLNPGLDLRVPWQALRAENEMPKYIPSLGSPAATSLSSTAKPAEVAKPPRPTRFAGQVMATVQNQPILCAISRRRTSGSHKAAEHERRHGNTRGYESPDDYSLERLRERILRPLVDEFKKEHVAEPTDAEIDEFIVHFRQARIDRRRESAEDLSRRKQQLQADRARLESPELPPQARKLLAQTIARNEAQIAELEKLPASPVPEMDAEHELFFAKWYIGNWKLQQALYKEYGGRAIFQQAGPEALDAMRDLLKQREREGYFTISDPELHDRFWEYFVNDRMHVFIPDPDRIFKHPWSPFENTDAAAAKE